MMHFAPCEHRVCAGAGHVPDLRTAVRLNIQISIASSEGGGCVVLSSCHGVGRQMIYSTRALAAIAGPFLAAMWSAPQEQRIGSTAFNLALRSELERRSPVAMRI